MASKFKTIPAEDRVSVQNNIHQEIPIQRGLVYGSQYGGDNIKDYAHELFQTVYDYPVLSSSANQIFDLTAGYSPNSSLSGSSNTQNAEKIDIYNEMASKLAGFDTDGNIREFDTDGNFSAGGTKMQEVFFVNHSRLLTKDEIKRETFSLEMNRDSTVGNVPDGSSTAIEDAGSFRSNSPSGEYALLTDGSTTFGHVYYQAGVSVITASFFNGEFGESGETAGDDYTDPDVDTALQDRTIPELADGFRYRYLTGSFNNTTEINSTIYFCNVESQDFNYSSNPTYTSGSEIQTKENQTDEPKSYVTTVGLYGPNDSLMAVGKTSEPIKNSPQENFVIRARVDY